MMSESGRERVEKRPGARGGFWLRRAGAWRRSVIRELQRESGFPLGRRALDVSAVRDGGPLEAGH